MVPKELVRCIEHRVVIVEQNIAQSSGITERRSAGESRAFEGGGTRTQYKGKSSYLGP